MKNLIVFFIVLLSLPIGANAQEHQHSGWCGTEISDEWMQAFYQRDKSHLTNKIGNFPAVYVPIVYHLVGEDNGTGYFPLADVFRAHCELQELYNDADVFFYIKNIEYIDNTSYYSGGTTYPLFTNYNDPNVCNVYFVSQMSGVCGYSFVPENWDGSGWSGPSRGGIMLAMNCMEPGNTTYRHEMGHYLNLPHTFYGWEGEDAPGIGVNAPNTIDGSPVERADQSNCFASGDGFCDTPPDYLSDRWSCTFARTYLDPAGTSFTVDERNFMSYSLDGCASYLKDQQLAEVNAAPANHRPYLLNDPVPPIQTLTQVSGLFPDGNTNNLNPTEIILSWNSTANADYYQLQATRFNFSNPSFDVVTADTFYVITNAAPGDDYQWRVKPINYTDVCTPFTPERTFSVSTLSADINVSNSTCVQNTDGQIQVVIAQAGNYNYYWSCNDPFINSTIQNINSNVLTNLSPETYFVTVVNASDDTLIAQANVLAPNELVVDINQVGSELVASVSGGTPPYSYIWDNGVEDLSLSNIESGDYTFIVVDQNGCQKSGTATFSGQATGIRDMDNELIGNILIAPNPSQSGQVKLIVPMNDQGIVDISVLDISGKTLNFQTVEAKEGMNTFNMDLGEISKGIYIVHAQSARAKQSAKLVIR